MSLPKFKENLLLSKTEIFEAINEAENQLFNLRFQKATRQNFKPHEIKHTKRRLAQLKTLLTVKSKDMNEEKDN